MGKIYIAVQIYMSGKSALWNSKMRRGKRLYVSRLGLTKYYLAFLSDVFLAG